MGEASEKEEERIPVVADYGRGASSLVISINGQPVHKSRYTIDDSGVLTFGREFYPKRDDT